jgi:hypothetical protein
MNNLSTQNPPCGVDSPSSEQQDHFSPALLWVESVYYM